MGHYVTFFTKLWYMKGTVFQPRVLQFNLDNINSSASTPTEKIGEFAGARIKPMAFCMLGRHSHH